MRIIKFFEKIITNKLALFEICRKEKLIKEMIRYNKLIKISFKQKISLTLFKLVQNNYYFKLYFM